jgi:nicotinate (nicotinamide) nucleotide adenylyltransferase
MCVTREATKRNAPTLRWLRRASRGVLQLTGPAAPGAPASPPRLGVLSGTFNPPTLAHVALAERAMKQLRLSEVLFVLPAEPPHKAQLGASLEERAQMLWLTVQGRESFSAALCSHGLLLDIHRAAADHFPAATQYLFLAGRDAAERILVHWPYDDIVRALEEMFGRFDFGVADREGKLHLPAGSPAEKYRRQIHSIDLGENFYRISASEVRERAARQESIAELVPDGVAELIESRGLYRKRRKREFVN